MHSSMHPDRHTLRKPQGNACKAGCLPVAPGPQYRRGKGRSYPFRPPEPVRRATVAPSVCLTASVSALPPAGWGCGHRGTGPGPGTRQEVLCHMPWAASATQRQSAPLGPCARSAPEMAMQANGPSAPCMVQRMVAGWPRGVCPGLGLRVHRWYPHGVPLTC